MIDYCKSTMLSPFVYWAQTECTISLKVDLKEVKSPDIALEDRKLHFCAEGCGAKGPHTYSFSLDFFSAVDPETSQYRILDREVDFTIRKKKTGFWPRVTSQPQKPVWLKIDFDKWISEEDLDDDEDRRDIMNDYPDLYEKLKKEELGYMKDAKDLETLLDGVDPTIEKFVKFKKDIKKVYLLFYNLSQFVGFLYILIVMAIRYFRDGPDSMEGTYEAVGSAIKFCQLMQFLEVMHPMFGYTKGNVITPLMQVGGRAFIVFCMLEAEPRMQTKPVVFYLFFVWSLVEIVRYPFYMLHLYKKDIGFVTWLRYTIWIPLYPLGFLCEGIIILRNIPYFEETQRFTVTLPNAWNFAFHFPSIMRIYLLILFFPALYAMMSHMYRERVKRLGPKSWKAKVH